MDSQNSHEFPHKNVRNGGNDEETGNGDNVHGISEEQNNGQEQKLDIRHVQGILQRKQHRRTLHHNSSAQGKRAGRKNA